nr:MAG TPA: hypothetical protein [Bacteriophage sp.]
MSITKYFNEEEYDIYCAKLKEDMILYINQFLHSNHWRMNYPSDRYVMISNIYNIAHRLLYDFKDGWYDHLSDTNFVEVSEYAKYFKSRIPLADDVKAFIQVVILYYFKQDKIEHFMITYNKILDDMCEFYDTSVAKRR